MSIFKATFKPFVCRQLFARQDLVSLTQRGAETGFHQYIMGKTPWVKMVSFVDYEEPKRNLSGNALAKKYILSAGTLYTDGLPDGQAALRYGLATKNGSYGGNIGNRDYGLVPMPGITSITVSSKSAYGSLREAVVKYIAWDKAQLEDLEILYQRPGFPVLLEWGWSMYLNTSVPGEAYNVDPDSKSIKTKIPLNKNMMRTFDDPTINPFDSDLTQEKIYEQIKIYQHRYSGNYDGILGFIRNFSWSILPNGAYECTTTLISIGDVLDSLKISSVSSDQQISNNQRGYKTDFGFLMDTLYSGSISDIQNEGVLSRYQEGILNDPTIDPVLYDLNYTLKTSGEKSPNMRYISLGFLIHILRTKFNLYDEKSRKLIDIEIPSYNPENYGSGLCLASVDSVSLDPYVCVLQNKQATFVCNNQKGYDIIGATDTPVVSNTNSPSRFREFLLPGTSLGIISNIYVNIKHVNDVYLNLLGENYAVDLYKFLKSLLSSISNAIGNINEFDTFVNDNKVVIIDKSYVEEPNKSKFDNKFQMNLIGLNAITKGINLQSNIFPNQATMIAVAAQDRENIAAINTSAYVRLHKGLSNRLKRQNTEIDVAGNTNPESAMEQTIALEKQNFLRNIVDLQDYINKLLVERVIPGDSNAANSMSSALNSLILKVNTDANYRAIIPLSLEVILEGISGLTIGEIFTVNPDVIPKEYYIKKLGFIVTGISENITTSEWSTKITTQICLLDQEELQATAVKVFDKSNYQSQIDTFRNTQVSLLNQSVENYNALVALIRDYYIKDPDLLPLKVGVIPGEKLTITSFGIDMNTGGNYSKISHLLVFFAQNGYSDKEVDTFYKNFGLFMNDAAQSLNLNKSSRGFISDTNAILGTAIITGLGPTTLVDETLRKIKKEVVKKANIDTFSLNELFLPQGVFSSSDTPENRKNCISFLETTIRNSNYFKTMNSDLRSLFSSQLDGLRNAALNGSSFNFIDFVKLNNNSKSTNLNDQYSQVKIKIDTGIFK